MQKYPFRKDKTIHPFSFICTICGQPIMSNTVTGEKCRLMYIKNNEIKEEIRGDYDCFGGVFTDEPSQKDGSYNLERKRLFWETDWNEIHSSILDVFNDEDGICAVHENCITDIQDKFVPSISETDPDDGSGLYMKKTDLD